MTHDIARTPGYRDFVRTLKQKVQSAQSKAARAVNSQLIELYWELGKLIAEKQKAAGWGDAVIEQIARDLTQELGGAKGFSRRNLYYMRWFYGFYKAQGEFVQQLVAQIPWGHHMFARPRRIAGLATSWRCTMTVASQAGQTALSTVGGVLVPLTAYGSIAAAQSDAKKAGDYYARCKAEVDRRYSEKARQ